MSLKKDLLKNGIATSLRKVIKILEQLLLIPFFISAWGAEYYGEWLTLTIIPSVLAFTNLGFGTSASNVFVLRYASGNKHEAANVAKSSFFVISIIIIIGVLVSAIIMYFMSYFDLFKNSVINQNDAVISVVMLMASRLLIFYQQLFEGFYRAAKKASLGLHIFNLFSLANLFGGFLVLNFNGGIIVFSLVSLLLTFLYIPIFGYIGFNILDLKEYRTAKIDKKCIIDEFKIGFGYMLNPAWRIIFFQGTTFAVRVVLGAESVTVFNTVRTLSRSINQFYTIINTSIFPELQYLMGLGDWNKARQLFRISLFFTLISAVLGMVFLSFFGLWFYHIWTNKSLEVPLSMWNIFVLGIGFNSMWWTSSVVFRAANKPYSFASAGVLSAIFSVILTFTLSFYYGLTGAALGALSLDLIMALYVLPVCNRILGQRNSSMIMEFIINDWPKIVGLIKLKLKLN